ncbi:MAG: LysM peptidoglycan-binding domain-containing protein [Legionellales bacterium]|nr:LysM peptidoglycan-binding domain-containing protein [Legionellales bacterium]
MTHVPSLKPPTQPFTYHSPDPNRYPDLWNILREQFILYDYSDSAPVRAQIRWYQAHPKYFTRVTNRARPYLFYIYQEMRARHLPVELCLLPMIESAYNPFAYSPVGAAGLWQIMPQTANNFRIKQDYWFDGRRDITSSTKMAVNYLSYLNQFFNRDWLLAIAAYDSGEGTVLNALQYNLRQGYAANFWNIPLPEETRSYVPSLLALIAIVRHPNWYGFHLPYIAATPYFTAVTVDKPMQLNKIAELAGMSLEDLYELNPGYNRFMTGMRGSFKLLIPINLVDRFQRNLAYYNHHSNMHHVVKHGESLKQIANHYHIAVSTLEKSNHLSHGNIHVGQTLTIPSSLTITADLAPAASAEPNEKTTTTHIVTKGDTLASIARKNHISIAELRDWNHLSAKSVIKIGEKLLIKTHPVVKSLTHNLTQYYIVESGDTLSGIAEKTNVPLATLKALNHLQDFSSLNPGQKIRMN